MPNRLVFLLDHEYTQRGLSWQRLKGVDAERATLLRAAARQAGCETVLALGEVKETWDAQPSDSDPWDDYDYDGHRDLGAAHDCELGELIDDEISLGWWTSPDGAGGEPISLRVPDHEVCAVTPNAQLEPYQSEYEGYMGNYGNTLDRWYRARRGRRMAEGPSVHGPCRAGTAAMLLEPFQVETVAPEHAGGLAAAGRYDPEWTRNVISGWFGHGHDYGTDRSEWVSDRLPGCARRCVPLGRRRWRGYWPPEPGIG